MRGFNRLTGGMIAVLLGLAALAQPAFALRPDEAFASDPSITIRYVPGKYYEYQAQLAVKKKDFAKALEMFQKAAYWGNKTAQYNVGMLYTNGAEGVPVDKTRGAAWLGIAAETHQAYVDKALGEAYGNLTADQRVTAGNIWKELRADYADKITLERANKKFNDELLREKGNLQGPPEYTTVVYGGGFGFGGGAAEHALFDSSGNMNTQIAQNSHAVNAAKFINAVKDQYEDYINFEYGRVSVGEPESLADHEKDATAARTKK
jgi:hypothetical protein